ncbi:quinoprotein dehydrogenase-associated putative ABC transporter substrate-binding protein [Sphingomonas sp. BN140010]|uniref:Quinoprotein dehydrogenase-associated putative ABC transporter substrate-binding protein n=1 Tax=Sphingomonas arvum TaxID=2992113 RepID=A0ABT3JI81_9SPHN|nr:quinoprotein dehydrogenase-associated putative ABC transporter substrate-binding protein [Sphingomonas sp. BN140010]MCW3798445.1 quinoprotein dehydrogenase-associated putative ABC transporter substrate-binding protein [Sphingomonas sp. BN140010]
MKWALALAALLTVQPAAARTLKVCADPNNLPFSNAKEEGFENRIVRIVAAELRADVEYVWWAQRRGNVRETLNAGLCDIIPGVGSSLDMLATTRPYYRSAYVAVVRDPALKGLSSFDDPRLARLKIGVQLIGDDGSNTPPAHALSRRGMIDNVRGFAVYGDYSQPLPQAPIVQAVASGEVDAAFVWGPTAAFFIRRSAVPLSYAVVSPLSDGPALPMAFDISMGMRRTDVPLRRELEAALERRAVEIRSVLVSYGVPLLDQP